MIAHASEVIWACPHCQQTQRRAAPADALTTQCTGCRFVFPVVAHDVESLEPRLAAPDDDTWTEKFGPIDTDRYRVIRVLASGAQGKILLARHRHLDERCVIKLVTWQDDLWAETANKRLRNEARAGIRVNHPNVARVLDCDCSESVWYLVMEFIAGDNLRRILQQVHHLSWQQVVQIGREVAAGLSAIHKSHLVHRDIKPSNLMLDREGVVKITDLGLVKIASAAGSPDITRAGQVLGTPLYMPPEQFDAAEKIDARADIYALGATLFHLLTGHPPFEAGDIDDIANKHRSAPITWSQAETQRIPRWLREVVEGCLAKRREHRFESAGDVQRALAKCQEAPPRPAQAAVSPSEGAAVLSFENLSRQPADDWIGDAIAEYLSSRLMEVDGLHVADRNVLAKVLRQMSKEPGVEPDRSGIIDAARMLGASHVITGSFHRQADEIRILAHLIHRDESKSRFLASVSGRVDSLFALEDKLTERVIESIGPLVSRAPHARPAGGGTDNLEAHEKYIRGNRAFADGDYRAAIALAEEALEFDSEYAEPLSLMGAGYARLGEYDRAVECHKRQERLARETGDDTQLAVALGNLGSMHYYQGQYDVAFEFLERASALAGATEPTPDTAKLYGNFGMVLMRLEKTEEAERAFERAIAISKQFNDLVSMVWPYNGMGGVLMKQGRLTEAREYHQRALGLAEEVCDRVLVGVSQMNIGRCACLAGDYAEAGIWFNSALGTLERTKFWNGLTLVFEHLADMHLLDNHPDEAITNIDRRIELARRHGNQRMESMAWEQRARAFEQMKRTDEALKALKKSVEVSQRPAPYESLHRYLQEVTSHKPFV